MFGIVKRLRRRRLRRQPFPAAWRAIAERNLPFYRRLGDDDRRELERLIVIFIAEKSFEGCGGQGIDDEVRVTVAGQACLLLLRRDADVYPRLDVILVYPTAVMVEREEHEGVIVRAGRRIHLGESWTRGMVILAWDHVLSGARVGNDGANVTLHELAHQLDAEDGAMDGTPQLEGGARYRSWAKVFSAEYDALKATLRRGKRSDIDAYGATNEPEFFAVVTEMFFEKPTALRRRHPELYDELRAFYRQDPASWPRR
ncbi:MAG: zinc-dependent peptidase [Myxococcales bacterium]|nr:zinc-dependent peptidase [Myxococcales bacterium]